MIHRKCHGFIEVNPIYEADPTVSWHCVKCGYFKEFEITDSGPGGVLARFLKRRSSTVSNGY